MITGSCTARCKRQTAPESASQMNSQSSRFRDTKSAAGAATHRLRHSKQSISLLSQAVPQTDAKSNDQICRAVLARQQVRNPPSGKDGQRKPDPEACFGHAAPQPLNVLGVRPRRHDPVAGRSLQMQTAQGNDQAWWNPPAQPSLHVLSCA